MSIIQQTLMNNYQKIIDEQRMRMEKDKHQRIIEEQNELEKVRNELELEKLKEFQKKQAIAKSQYEDYLESQKIKRMKDLKQLQEKIEPTGVSLDMGYEERQKNYQNRIIQLSNQIDQFGKMYSDYNEKSKNDVQYNYLSKKFAPVKEVNKTLPEDKIYNIINNKANYYNPNVIYNTEDKIFINKDGSDLEELSRLQKISGAKRESTDVTNQAIFDKYFNNSYKDYKKINEDYYNYNKQLAEENLRFKEQQFFERQKMEEQRRLERERIANLEREEKLFSEEKKRQYKNILDQQINSTVPMKLKNESYSKNAASYGENKFHNDDLYKYDADYNFMNKNQFIEVNPYNAKRYYLGDSQLASNPIINSEFNYKYNKYLFPQSNRSNREKSSPLLRTTGSNVF